MEEDANLVIFRRRYLPHLEVSGGCYFVTFRLRDSLPQALIRETVEGNCKMERKDAEEDGYGIGTTREWDRFAALDRHLDAGKYGSCHLDCPAVARITVEALRHFHEDRLRMHAFCVMPNHVHTVFEPLVNSAQNSTWAIESLMHSIKSYSGHQANKILGLSRSFWQREYYDRWIRDEVELARCIEYTLNNPVSAGLCERAQD
jgi:Transposase IS200 like.